MPNSPSPEPDEPAPNETQTTDLQPSMTVHPLTYSTMPMHMYPFPSGIVPSPPTRSKRRQVKNACTNCQKACKKCDDARPCLRCVKYGIAEECVDSHRKERKKGIKRGPYKKRDGKRTSASIADLLRPHVTQHSPWIRHTMARRTSRSKWLQRYQGDPLPYHSSVRLASRQVFSASTLLHLRSRGTRRSTIPSSILQLRYLLTGYLPTKMVTVNLRTTTNTSIRPRS